MLPLCTAAQKSQRAIKKEISQARDKVKEGKNLDKVEASMRKLLKDSANRDNVKIWNVLIEAVRGQYAQANEKLYLKQKQDTAALFKLASQLFTDACSLDTIDAHPNKKGRVVPVYRQRNAHNLMIIRPNLYHGGYYFIMKGNYQEAYHLFSQYIDCARQPLFSSIHADELGKWMPQAAYGAMYCGNRMDCPGKVLRYKEVAQQDTAHLDRVWQFMCEAYYQLGDTANYVNTLRKGVSKYPAYPYFFPRLVAYEQQRGREDEAKKVVDRALATDSTNVIFLLGKCSVLLNLGQYDECIRLSRHLVEQDDSLADAHYYAGLSFFNKAILQEKKLMLSELTKKQRQKARGKIMALYEQSRPYLERYRQLSPKDVRKWSAPLYTIYFNLNMGKEFDEIDKLRNEYRKHIK